jgi:uncharacterized membrane protein YkvA (DUF1232 family)
MKVFVPDGDPVLLFHADESPRIQELTGIIPRVPEGLDRELDQKRMAMFEGELDNSTIADMSSSRENSAKVGRLSALLATWSEKAQKLQKEAHVFYFAFKHPGTPWYARLIAACAAGYLVSPIQIIPSFIPVIGFMDDLVVLVVGFKLIQKAISPEVLKECRERAEAAELQRKAKDSSATELVVSITVAILWLMSAIAGSLLIASYFRHR